MATTSTPTPSTSSAFRTAEGNDTPYSQSFFAATHNSYSGGTRGTFTEQLDRGVRFLELDLNLGSFSKNHDYQIGHGSPGRQVDHSPGNPASNDMTAWLDLIVGWSDSHPGHAPITIGLDLKGNLASQTSPQNGNFCALNELVAKSLGKKLFTPKDLAAQGGVWPSVSGLGGRILAVISGNASSREGYLADLGTLPAVGMNDAGWVVEVHESEGRNGLWYWTGRLQADGSVTWLSHGKYDTGKQPAVVVNNDGVVVEVHKSENRDKLYYHVGQLAADGSLSWGDSHNIGSGVMPSLAFGSLGGLEVVEIHQDGGNQRMSGRVDPASKKIDWSDPQPTSSPRFNTAQAKAGGHTVSVFTGTSAGTPDTLLYDTDRFGPGRIRYDQLLFTEFQKGNSKQLANDDLAFYAASASNLSWGGDEQAAGKIVRLWKFSQSSTSVSPPISFPATDTPYADWYLSYCAQIGAVK